MQNPAEISRSSGELKPICSERSGRCIGVPNACCEVFEKGRFVDHFHGRYFTGFEGEILGFDADAAAKMLALTKRRSTLFRNRASTSQACFT